MSLHSPPGAWNSAKEGLLHAGLHVHECLMLLTYNVGYGEWNDGLRYEKLRIAVADSINGSSEGVET